MAWGWRARRGRSCAGVTQRAHCASPTTSPRLISRSLEPCGFAQHWPARTAEPAPLQQALGTRCFGKSNLRASAGSGELSSLENLASALGTESLQMCPHTSTHKPSGPLPCRPRLCLSSFGSCSQRGLQQRLLVQRDCLV